MFIPISSFITSPHVSPLVPHSFIYSMKPTSASVFTCVNLRACASTKSGPKNHQRINNGYLCMAGVWVTYPELFLSF